MAVLKKPIKAILSGADVVALGEFAAGDAIPAEFGGTGLDTLGAANQVLGVTVSGAIMEYKTITAGINVVVTHAPNVITIDLTSQDGNHLINYLMGVR